MLRRAAAPLLLLLALVAPATAAAETRTLTFFSAAHTIGGFEAEQQVELVDSPPVDGYVVGLHADVVRTPTASAPDLDVRTVMLHHIVFSKVGVPDATCPMSQIPAQRFYAEGEERARFTLPEGYGYANAAGDRWAMVWMLMNHLPEPETVYVRYRVTYVVDEPRTPVTPYWLDVANCTVDPVFDVPGTAGRGSTARRSTEVVMPEGGRIVAGGGHLHGGGKALVVSDPDCRRGLFQSRPVWGAPGSTPYLVRPVLHEPGPIHMTQFTAADGLPVAKGHRLRLDALYDGSRPHTRVMGITIAYVAHDRPVEGCPPLGGKTWAPKPAGRLLAPVVRVPLFTVPGGPAQATTRTAVTSRRFTPGVVQARVGQTHTWRFAAAELHDVTLANGPVGFSSPQTMRGTFRHRFTRPGTYELFCSLHPASMTQVVKVAR